jgi:catechol-2,3-dioxygenase
MPVTEINHFNLRAPREMMHVLKDFYCNIVGLRDGPRAGLTSYGFWLYIGDNDVLHLSESQAGVEPLTHVVTTFDHVSFSCTDDAAMEAHLKANNVLFTTRIHTAIRVKQINFKDPVGNGVELNFKF